MEQTDRDLVDRVVSGDEEAFTDLFARHRDALRRHVLGIVRDPAGADDITQEVFLRLWRQAGQWRGESPLRAWLLRVGTNVSLNHLRTVKRRREQPIEAASPNDEEDDESAVPAWMVDAITPTPEEALARRERTRLLRDVVDDLPTDKRDVVRRVVDAHMDLRQVAADLGIPEGTVKSRMHHARKQIASTWREAGLDWEDLS